MLTVSKFATPDEKHWVALTGYKRAGMLVQIGCIDHIIGNIYAMLDLKPFNQCSEIPKEKFSEWYLEAIIPWNKGESH